MCSREEQERETRAALPSGVWEQEGGWHPGWDHSLGKLAYPSWSQSCSLGCQKGSVIKAAQLRRISIRT